MVCTVLLFTRFRIVITNCSFANHNLCYHPIHETDTRAHARTRGFVRSVILQQAARIPLFPLQTKPVYINIDLNLSTSNDFIVFIHAVCIYSRVFCFLRFDINNKISLYYQYLFIFWLILTVFTLNNNKLCNTFTKQVMYTKI